MVAFPVFYARSQSRDRSCILGASLSLIHFIGDALGRGETLEEFAMIWIVFGGNSLCEALYKNWLNKR
jgi:hypothetical protein